LLKELQSYMDGNIEVFQKIGLICNLNLSVEGRLGARLLKLTKIATFYPQLKILRT